ncbi:MAG: GntR family transcriptional regulator [Desulfobacteraceae bacterium]|nr:GntR family transcriptional regulator [Desulfobacteraceae bacterium]
MKIQIDPSQIYSTLRKKIIHLELAPGSVLNLSDLAKEFKVSRTPIKEALISLQSEEWIRRHGSHFIVTPLSLGRIREITEIRMVMEVQANIWAMERITTEEIKALDTLKEKIGTFDDSSSNLSIVGFDFTIHHSIFQIAKNRHLEKILERILSHYLRFWLSIPRQIDHTVFFTESLELIEAIGNKDKLLIREHTTRHIQDSVAQIMGTG